MTVNLGGYFRMTEQDVPDAPDDDVPQPANDPVQEPPPPEDDPTVTQEIPQ